MARDTTDERPIETKSQLVDWLAVGCKPKSDWRIGTEHEKFAFYRDSHKPVPYGGDNGIRAILEGMQKKLGWEPIIDDGNLIGLFEETVRVLFRWSRVASSNFPVRRLKPCTRLAVNPIAIWIW